ncbi:MAG TPA: hypothetical protein VEA69_04310, partial [Tepidisphaeraceae bacterium]|nr:hypothetical protein [Tepidisphaeraceae bacterium]
AGLLGMLFFWLTDPVWGVGALRVGAADRPTTQPATPGEERLVVNPIDSRNEAIVGTTIGIGGSAVVLLFGLVIAMRRPT